MLVVSLDELVAMCYCGLCTSNISNNDDAGSGLLVLVLFAVPIASLCLLIFNLRFWFLNKF